jgi:predicted carbohydrate-binding protein with CBM5 and CBM33 domain
MKEAKGPKKPIDKEIAGETIEAHGVIVTPFARVRCQADAQSDERGSWKWGWAVIQPTRVTTQDRTGQLGVVKLQPTEGQVLGAMAAVAVVVAVVSVLISALARKQR